MEELLTQMIQIGLAAKSHTHLPNLAGFFNWMKLDAIQTKQETQISAIPKYWVLPERKHSNGQTQATTGQQCFQSRQQQEKHLHMWLFLKAIQKVGYNHCGQAELTSVSRLLRMKVVKSILDQTMDATNTFQAYRFVSFKEGQFTHKSMYLPMVELLERYCCKFSNA